MVKLIEIVIDGDEQWLVMVSLYLIMINGG